MLIILFGFPGVGKNYIGKILEKNFYFYHYDADKDLTPEIIKTVESNRLVTDRMRDKYYTRVMSKIKVLGEKYRKIVVTDAIPKEKYRKLYLKNFPEAKLVYVKSNMKIIKGRVKSRKHLINDKYLEKILTYFEVPKTNYYILKNNDSGDKVIKEQIKRLLK